MNHDCGCSDATPALDRPIPMPDPYPGPLPDPWPQPLPQPLPQPGPFDPRRPLPPEFPIDIRCFRRTGISGRYSGYAAISLTKLAKRLELRLDVDTRYSADSPVMNKVSGDFFTSRIIWPGRTETYLSSWVVDHPVVSWTRCKAVITGRVRFYSGTTPATDVRIEVTSTTSATPSVRWNSKSTTAPAPMSRRMLRRTGRDSTPTIPPTSMTAR
jgi:hypothetical protein